MIHACSFEIFHQSFLKSETAMSTKGSVIDRRGRERAELLSSDVIRTALRAALGERRKLIFLLLSDKMPAS